jgi:hypothetical protein
VALSLGEDRGQESYPIGCVRRPRGDRARRLLVKDRDGRNRAAAAPAAVLRPGTAAGAVCVAGPGTEAVRLEEEAGPPRAASREEDDDHHNDDGPEPVNRRLGV